MSIKSVIRNSPLPLAVVRSAVKWYADKLMGKRLARNITCRFEFIQDYESDSGTTATCIWEDDNVRPREFLIELDASLDPATILQNLAHEMVHVKQWARGELKDVLREYSLCKWKGTVIDTDKIDYYDSPWEIEAFGREYGLYVRWRDQYPPVKAIIGELNEEE